MYIDHRYENRDSNTFSRNTLFQRTAYRRSFPPDFMPTSLYEVTKEIVRLYPLSQLLFCLMVSSPESVSYILG